MDTLWSDVSSYQCVVDDSYPYQVLAIRSNDGTYEDPKFAENYAWACRALDSGKLSCLIVYFVWRQNWQTTIDTHKRMIGNPRAGVVSMLDVESWGGQITGDQSDGINRAFWGLANWWGNQLRVIGYGNRSDLDTLWPTKPSGVRLVVAAYGSNPNYPGKLGHQFTDGVNGGPVNVAPFGLADVNSADGYSTDAFLAAVGLTGPALGGGSGATAPAAPATPTRKGVPDMLHVQFDAFTGSRWGRIICPVGSAAGDGKRAWLSATCQGGATFSAWFQRSADSDAAMPGAGDPVTWTLRNASRPWHELPDGTEVVEYCLTDPKGYGAIGIELSLSPK